MFRSHTVAYQQGRKRTFKRNVEARSRNHCCHTKARSILYSECVSIALVIKHAKRIYHVMLSSVACLALPCYVVIRGLSSFTILSHVISETARLSKKKY